jgi:DNA-directed RNA polymerase specialized sigma24 family protein
MAIDIRNTFDLMRNKRYVEVLQLMLVEGFDANAVAAKLGTTVSNIHNIKHRAIVQFIEVYSAQ